MELGAAILHLAHSVGGEGGGLWAIEVHVTEVGGDIKPLQRFRVSVGAWSVLRSSFRKSNMPGGVCLFGDGLGDGGGFLRIFLNW